MASCAPHVTMPIVMAGMTTVKLGVGDKNDTPGVTNPVVGSQTW